jgi:hypothetical protein
LGALAIVNSDGSSWGGGTEGAVFATTEFLFIGPVLVLAASVHTFIREVIIQKDGSGVIIQKDGSGVVIQKDRSG